MDHIWIIYGPPTRSCVSFRAKWPNKARNWPPPALRGKLLLCTSISEQMAGWLECQQSPVCESNFSSCFLTFHRFHFLEDIRTKTDKNYLGCW